MNLTETGIGPYVPGPTAVEACAGAAGNALYTSIAARVERSWGAVLGSLGEPGCCFMDWDEGDAADRALNAGAV